MYHPTPPHRPATPPRPTTTTSLPSLRAPAVAAHSLAVRTPRPQSHVARARRALLPSPGISIAIALLSCAPPPGPAQAPHVALALALPPRYPAPRLTPIVGPARPPA
ncbi:hypothetical protein U9M48_040321 [Paspalum notatum var. saurae]|uniref:Uncharacterized protein n=1 Tax=Paspalum notatum var. saurae TaxID=547442 RepID=A0AAQ3UKS4_PASNO